MKRLKSRTRQRITEQETYTDTSPYSSDGIICFVMKHSLQRKSGRESVRENQIIKGSQQLSAMPFYTFQKITLFIVFRPKKTMNL
jgi:hypothetical protein